MEKQLINSAAVMYAVMCAGVIAFQFCLIGGAPWGRLTQGGQHPHALPGSGRVIAGISVVLLILMAGSILSAANIWVNWSPWMSWGALGIQSLSTLLNWITPSRSERLLWGPVTTAMLVMALLVMLT
jgi:hypothetical protein